MASSNPYTEDAPVSQPHNEAEAASRLEKLPTELVTGIAEQLDSSNRKTLRLTSKRMEAHLEYIMKQNFKHLRCPVLFSELHELFLFKHSPLARAVKSLTLVFLDSEAVKRDLEACRLSTRICEDVKDFLESRNGVEEYQTIFTLVRSRSMIADALEGLRNLDTVAFAFEALPTLLDPLGSVPVASTHNFQDSFMVRFLEGTTRPLLVRVHDPPKRWSFVWTGTEATSMSYETLLPPEQLDDFNRKGFLLPAMTWFLQDQCRHLKSLHLHNVAVPLQTIEMIFDPVGTLEVLSITESRILEDCLRFPATFSHPESKLRKSLRELSLRACTGQRHVASLLPCFFHYFEQDGRLESFQFEQIENLWFDWDLADWDPNAPMDDGSRLPEVIAQLGMKAALARSMRCCRWQMTPRHPRLEELFPR